MSHTRYGRNLGDPARVHRIPGPHIHNGDILLCPYTRVHLEKSWLRLSLQVPKCVQDASSGMLALSKSFAVIDSVDRG